MEITKVLIAAVMLCYLPSVAAQSTYKIPPSASTLGSVAVISDEKMEECVELYNRAEWLGEKIEAQEVDRYSEESVESYNNEVSKHSALIKQFNLECAGKQSRSACEAAQKLNREKGLRVTSC